MLRLLVLGGSSLVFLLCCEGQLLAQVGSLSRGCNSTCRWGRFRGSRCWRRLRWRRRCWLICRGGGDGTLRRRWFCWRCRDGGLRKRLSNAGARGCLFLLLLNLLLKKVRGELLFLGWCGVGCRRICWLGKLALGLDQRLLLVNLVARHAKLAFFLHRTSLLGYRCFGLSFLKSYLLLIIDCLDVRLERVHRELARGGFHSSDWWCCPRFSCLHVACWLLDCSLVLNNRRSLSQRLRLGCDGVGFRLLWLLHGVAASMTLLRLNVLLKRIRCKFLGS